MTGPRSCLRCGAPIPPPLGPSRHLKWCSVRCMRKAHVEKHPAYTPYKTTPAPDR